MSKNLTQEMLSSLEEHPTLFVLETRFSSRERRQVRWITAIAPWHHDSYFEGDSDSYDGLLHDNVETTDEDGLPSGTLGGNNDYLCAINTYEYEVMLLIGKALAEISQSPQSFDEFWLRPQSFLRSRGVDRSYRHSYPISIQRGD